MKKTYTLCSKLMLTLFLVLLTSVSYSQNQQIFTTSSTFTVPFGVTSITVEAWGGGGKGGTRTSNGGAGGGGGGGYSRSVIAVTPLTTYTVTVGAGSSTTSSGEDSWFGSTATILAKGGNSVSNNTTAGGAGGLASDGVGDVKFNGGNGFTTGTSGGGGGSSAGNAANGNNATNATGATAPAGGGNGGNGATSSANGAVGFSPGGGGGGASRSGFSQPNRIGGNGADGQVIITFTLQNGPGGITSGLQLWLRADLLNGTTTVANNIPVSSWITQALGSNATVHTAGQEPTYKNNATSNVNFNPVVDFNNVSTESSSSYNYALLGQQYLGGDTGYYTQDQFIVLIPNITVNNSFGSMDIFCADSDINVQTNDATGVGFGAYTQRFSNEVVCYAYGTSSGLGNGYGVAETSTTKTYSNVGIINARNNAGATAQELYYNGVNVVNTTSSGTFTNLSNGKYWIGRSEGWEGSLDARVAEIITFSSRKGDATERNRIEGYLGIKYGITLGVNGTSQNYVNSNGDIIWNITANSGFNFNIAGIGRDDVSRLNQKQSRSANSSTEVAIGLGEIATTNTANTNTFTTDRDYLVWGSNDLSFGSSSVTTNTNLGITSTSFIAGNRKYKIVETGVDVGQVVVSLPKTTLTSAFSKTATQEYVLIVSSTSAFGANDIVDIIPMTDTGTNFETWYDFDGTKFFSFGIANQVEGSFRLDNQANDFILGDRNVDLSSSFTVSGWMRTSTANGTFIAKNGAYQFYVNGANKVVGNWNNGDRIISNTSINDGKWHYVAITFSGGTANLYIDGILDTTASSLPTPASNVNNFSIGALWQNKSSITSIFNGDIDEVRIWNTVLTIDQIRYIMNQEIEKSGTSVTFGKVIPNTITKNHIAAIPWNNLQSYYDLNSFYGTSIKDKSDNNRWARIKYLTVDKITIGTQTAPMPYLSTTDGLWQSESTWVNGSVQTLPNDLSIVNNAVSVDWNIVQTQHAVTSNGNKTLLGLSINSNTLSAENDTKFEISHYLKINGKLDLVGKSQLIQTLDSDFDATSSGSLERDQQGKSNKFDYNYWSSPVGTINSIVNNGTYTVNTVLKDGTTGTSQNITWTSGYNGAPTSPITLSSYWIYKFQTAASQYANWIQVGQNGTLLAGQGFTMKGSGAASAEQNYTFVGKPNNGKIQFNMGPNLINLTGNPFPSAIDANKFITDNLASTNGTLYFWDHFGGETHILLSYLGGYATRNLTGGVVAMSAPGLQDIGPGTKVPNRFVPVGQGFFIHSSAIGGDVVFNNDQREFVKEDSANSNFMFRQSNQAYSAVPETDHFTNNSDDLSEETDEFIRIRLGFSSRNDYHRQVLLGFMNNLATSEIDPGYDAIHIDSQVNDMYFIHDETKLVILGDSYFDVDKIYPLAVKCDAFGTVKFMVDEVENLDASQNIYIFDNMTGIYHNITNEMFQIPLEAGLHDRRFSLRFTTEENLGTGEHELTEGIHIAFTSNDNILHIKNQLLHTTVTSVSAFNMLGQNLGNWDVRNETQLAIEIPISNLSTGTYIVKIQTTNGNLSKKIIIK